MNAPSTTHVLRLSPRDQQLISAGLAWIVANYDLYRIKGRVPNARPERRWKRNFNLGVYDQRLMDRVLVFHAKVSSLTAGGRLRVATSAEFAACALAVRVAVTRHHHRHRLLDIADVENSSARLLRRIEAARKRAKRAEVRQLGENGYQDAARAWRNFSTWLRVHFLDCRCKRKRRAPPKRYHRALVHQFAQLAWNELTDRRHKIPDDRELRRLVRACIRYVRRGRSRFSMRDLLTNQITAASHFANFVILHDEKAERKKGRSEQKQFEQW
jgi:hypothetical protein